MIRILFYLAIVFALGLGFAWLAERPGEMVVTFGGYQYEVTLMVAAAMVTALVAAIMISWWLIKSIWNSPYAVSRYFRVRRRDRGYQALSTGMIAAGAGDAVLARKKKKEAMKLISGDQEPLIHLLDAQASLLEGDHEAARRKFEAMLDDPEMRVLGLRGLYLEAERLGDRQVARHYAERAAEMAPQLGWAASATLESRSAAGDWDGALRLLDAQKAAKQLPGAEIDRKRAVILTAKARSLLDSDPLAAKNAAIEANRLAPDLVPAAVIAARALFRQGDLRKGSKILETAWSKQAHPEIADAYTHARHGDSVQDRLHRAKKLQAQKQNNAESAIAVARAALEAGEFALARDAAATAIRIDPREGAYLLMADIEEADGGSQGVIRQLLAKAVRAPQDPAWVADGVVSESWEPVSPVTGRLDAFEWRPPVERPLAQIEHEDAPALVAIEAAPEATPEPVPQAGLAAAAPQDVVDVEPEPVVAPDRAPAGATDKAAEKPQDEKPAAAAGMPRTAAPAIEAANDEKGPAQPVEPPIPDDPGVDPDDRENEDSRRFRLF